jgi:hypothetical protein
VVVVRFLTETKFIEPPFFIFYPIFYPSFTPSNPLPRHQALDIFSAACASAGLVEVVWELRRPWLLLTLHVCFQDGINKIDMCVCACTYVRTYKSFMRILCMYIYIHVYTFIVDDYVILLLLPIPLRLPLLSLFLRFFFFLFFLFFFFFFFFIIIIIIFFFFFVLFFFLLLIVLSSSPTSSSSIHQQNQQHLVPIDFSQHTQNIKGLEGHHAPQSVKVLVSLSTFGCPAQTNQFLGCANERMPGGRDRLVIEVPLFPDLQTLTSQKYRT